MLNSLALLILLTLLVTSASTLTSQEACELCQMSLSTVYAHFEGNVPSCQKLAHQLRHECKRHFNYRRRCLLLMKPNVDVIFREMTHGRFRPLEACMLTKECSLQKPQTTAQIGTTNGIYGSSR